MGCHNNVTSCTCRPCPIKGCGKAPRHCQHGQCPICKNMTIYCQCDKCQHCNKLFMKGCRCSPCHICNQTWVLCTCCSTCNRRSEDCNCCSTCGYSAEECICSNGAHTGDCEYCGNSLSNCYCCQIHKAGHCSCFEECPSCGLTNKECSCDHCNRCGLQLDWCDCETCYRCELWTNDCVCNPCPHCFRQPNDCPCPQCTRCRDKPCICETPCSQCFHTSLGGRPCQCRRALPCRTCRRDDCPGCMPYPPYEQDGAQSAHPDNEAAPQRRQTYDY